MNDDFQLEYTEYMQAYDRRMMNDGDTKEISPVVVDAVPAQLDEATQGALGFMMALIARVERRATLTAAQEAVLSVVTYIAAME